MVNDDFFDNIEEYLKKTNIEFDILFVDYITKDKIALLVNKILNKYNIEKYYGDVIYILMELISNAVKARYLHLISLKILSEMYPNYSLDEYYTNPEIMKKYSDEAYKQGEEAGKEIGKEIGQRQANIAAIKNMIIRFQATKEVILEDYTESEYNTAIAELQSESR